MKRLFCKGFDSKFSKRLMKDIKAIYIATNPVDIISAFFKAGIIISINGDNSKIVIDRFKVITPNSDSDEQSDEYEKEEVKSDGDNEQEHSDDEDNSSNTTDNEIQLRKKQKIEYLSSLFPSTNK